jgi:hypothetical protein
MANGNLRLARVLNLLLLHLVNRPSQVSAPVLAEWESAACRALEVLAASWNEFDEKALQTALNKLEDIKLDESRRDQNHDAWVFTQLSRGSTELSAMIIDVLPDGISWQPQQA